MSMEIVYNTRGRPIIFTPERMEQIKNLVDRGHSREQIAEIIGCSLGSLQVTCSRLGISLRRHVIRSVLPLPIVVAAADPPKDDGKGGSDNGQPRIQPSTDSVSLSLRIEYRGRTREIKIPLPSQALIDLFLEAEVRGGSLADLIGDILTNHINKKD